MKINHLTPEEKAELRDQLNGLMFKPQDVTFWKKDAMNVIAISAKNMCRVAVYDDGTAVIWACTPYESLYERTCRDIGIGLMQPATAEDYRVCYQDAVRALHVIFENTVNPPGHMSDALMQQADGSGVVRYAASNVSVKGQDRESAV